MVMHRLLHIDSMVYMVDYLISTFSLYMVTIDSYMDSGGMLFDALILVGRLSMVALHVFLFLYFSFHSNN
jgi:hypothetical protein